MKLSIASISARVVRCTPRRICFWVSSWQDDHSHRGKDISQSIAFQADGKIVAAGYSAVSLGPDFDFAVARYNANGSQDTTFGSSGKVTTSFGTDDDRAFAVAVQADGKIVAAGYSGSSSAAGTRNFVLARYLP